MRSNITHTRFMHIL